MKTTAIALVALVAGLHAGASINEARAPTGFNLDAENRVIWAECYAEARYLTDDHATEAELVELADTCLQGMN